MAILIILELIIFWYSLFVDIILKIQKTFQIKPLNLYLITKNKLLII